MFIPGLLVRQATEDLAASALPDAPCRPMSRRRPAWRRARAVVGYLIRGRGAPALPPEPLLPEAEWHLAEAVACSKALRDWASASRRERATAFAAYRAALDREAAAASALGRALLAAES